jgi:hypothetical protein
MLTFLKNARRQTIANKAFRNYATYALGEIFLVVVGILIALQINNWVQYRQDRQNELMYLRELLMEVKQDSVAFAMFYEANSRSVNHARIVLIRLDASSPVARLDTLEFLNEFKSVYNAIPAKLVGTIWEELQYTGNMQLLTNRDLVRQLSTYYEQQEVVYALAMGEIARDLEDAHRYDKLSFTTADIDDYFLDFKLDKVNDKKTVEKILKDPQAKIVMRKLMVSSSVLLLNTQMLQKHAEEISQSLRSEISTKRL